MVLCWIALLGISVFMQTACNKCEECTYEQVVKDSIIDSGLAGKACGQELKVLKEKDYEVDEGEIILKCEAI